MLSEKQCVRVKELRNKNKKELIKVERDEALEEGEVYLIERTGSLWHNRMQCDEICLAKFDDVLMDSIELHVIHDGYTISPCYYSASCRRENDEYEIDVYKLDNNANKNKSKLFIKK